MVSPVTFRRAGFALSDTIIFYPLVILKMEVKLVLLILALLYRRSLTSEAWRLRIWLFWFSFRKSRRLGGGAAVLTGRLLVLAGGGVGDLALAGWPRWYGGLR